MRSLRTDDIIGARPIFRHPPKAFIRQRQVPSPSKMYGQQTLLQNYQSKQFTYPSKQSNFIQDINMSSSQYQKSPQISQYKKGSYEIKNSYAPVMSPRNQINMQHHYPEYSKMLQNQTKDWNNALQQEIRHINPERSQEIKIKENSTVQEIPKQINFAKEAQSNNTEPIIRRKSSQQSNTSERNINGENSRHTSLFKGLGFNIITNTKYTYDFEKTFDKKDRSYSGM